MRHTTKTLQLNEQYHFPIRGDFIHLYSATGAIQIRINDDLMIFEAGSFYQAPNAFDEITIINQFSGTNAINLLIGQGRYSPPNRIEGIIQTQAKSVAGHRFKTLNIEGLTQLLDFNADRLSIHIHNKTGSILKLGGIDVLLAYIEIEPAQTYSDKISPTLELWAIGDGKVCVTSKYKTQQLIIQLSHLVAGGYYLTSNNNQLTSY